MLLKILDRLEETLISFLIAGATIIIFLSVGHRYLSTVPGIQDFLLTINFSWAQELCIIMFVWMAKFGAAYGVRTGIHVGVDVVINRMKDKSRTKFVIFGLLAGAFFTGTVGTMGANFVWKMAQTNSTSPDLELPKWLVYMAIPLGSYLMCFRFLQVTWAFIKTGELPHHDETEVEGLEEGGGDLLGDMMRNAQTPIGHDVDSDKKGGQQ